MVSTFALHPKVDPYVTAAVAFSRLAMAGVTSVAIRLGDILALCSGYSSAFGSC